MLKCIGVALSSLTKIKLSTYCNRTIKISYCLPYEISSWRYASLLEVSFQHGIPIKVKNIRDILASVQFKSHGNLVGPSKQIEKLILVNVNEATSRSSFFANQWYLFYYSLWVKLSLLVCLGEISSIWTFNKLGQLFQ